MHFGLGEALRRTRDDRAPEGAQLAFRSACERLERGGRGALHVDALEPVGDLASRRRTGGSSPPSRARGLGHVPDGLVLEGVVGAA